MPKHDDWLEYAQEDIYMAKLGVQPDHMTVRSALYHAQQCAEKALKAYLVFKNKPLRRTHDLTGLLELCAASDQEFLDLTADALDVNPFSVATRYPDDAYIVPDLDYAVLIIEKADRILDFVSQKVKFSNT